MNHPEDPLGTNIYPVVEMITQEDQSGVALSAMHQLVNDFELTKQKLADEKEERRVEKINSTGV